MYVYKKDIKRRQNRSENKAYTATDTSPIEVLSYRHLSFQEENNAICDFSGG